MALYFCHENPEVLCLETEIVSTRPGAVLLAATPFYPGGGGQLPDQGVIRSGGGEIAVTGFEVQDGKLWHLLADPVELAGGVEAAVDPVFRQLMRELHTDLHIVNALVYQGFNGALVTGVQMNNDGTARIDFDLPEADNERLRALEPAINDAIRQDLSVRQTFVSETESLDEPGLIRSRSVAPPPHRRWQDPHYRDRRPRSPGLRRHTSHVDRRVTPAAYPEDRKQGPAQQAPAYRS
jgi:misacylated tRNA(Ala) deacylase